MPDALNKPLKSPQKAATIYDVAERAKVSIKTVSKVINNLPEVSQATRLRVQTAIDELSYRPNQLARGLATQRSFMIGLFCDAPAAGSGYIASIQMAILMLCQNEGYHLIIELVHANNRNLEQQVRALLAQSKLAGVVLTPPLSDLPVLVETLKSTKTPIVRLSPETAMADVIDVDIDNVQAAYDITQYLIGLGHRRIGFIRGPLDHADARSRLTGYHKALDDAGIPFRNDYCLTGNFTYKSGMLAGDKLLARNDRPTAIFASNDDMAAGVMAAAYRHNLRIPQDLSIAGFDDAMFAHSMSPRLTTCRQPIGPMAQTAVSALIHPGSRPAGPLHLPHKIIVRGSTGRLMSAGLSE